MYFAARLARQWMKERKITCMAFECWLHVFRGSFGSAVAKSKRAKRAGSFGAGLKVALYSVV